VSNQSDASYTGLRGSLAIETPRGRSTLPIPTPLYPHPYAENFYHLISA